MSTLPDPASWPRCTFRAMGCQMSVYLATDAATAAAPLCEAIALFATVEQAMSRFIPASELCHLNARPGMWQPLSPLLETVLGAALALAEESEGAFDPTLLNALEAAGYRHSFEQGGMDRLPSPAPPTQPGRFREVRCRPGELWLPPGVRLDLGGIAKGYTAGLVVERLRRWGPVLVDAGGDLVAGEAPPGYPGWPVSVAAPWEEEAAPQELLLLWLANATLATSGVDYRRWRQGDDIAHHIIAPDSGQPAATDLLTATILNPCPMRAEAWATATLVKGKERGTVALLAHQLAGALVSRRRTLTLTPAMHSAVAGIAQPLAGC